MGKCSCCGAKDSSVLSCTKLEPKSTKPVRHECTADGPICQGDERRKAKSVAADICQKTIDAAAKLEALDVADLVDPTPAVVKVETEDPKLVPVTPPPSSPVSERPVTPESVAPSVPEQTPSLEAGAASSSEKKTWKWKTKPSKGLVRCSCCKQIGFGNKTTCGQPKHPCTRSAEDGLCENDPDRIERELFVFRDIEERDVTPDTVIDKDRKSVGNEVDTLCAKNLFICNVSGSTADVCPNRSWIEYIFANAHDPEKYFHFREDGSRATVPCAVKGCTTKATKGGHVHVREKNSDEYDKRIYLTPLCARHNDCTNFDADGLEPHGEFFPGQPVRAGMKLVERKPPPEVLARFKPAPKAAAPVATN